MGELGSGKTHFIKGLAAGVGVGRVQSHHIPLFAFIHEYQGRIPFFHIDLFRLTTEEEAEDLGLEEYFGEGGVTAIEWADRIPNLLPEALLWINSGLSWRTCAVYRNPWKRRSIRRIDKGTEQSQWACKIISCEFGVQSSEQKFYTRNSELIAPNDS